MIELRWIKRPATTHWPMNFHLQYKQGPMLEEVMWIDVPIVEEKKEKNLVEKMMAAVDHSVASGVGDYEKLAEVARQHFQKEQS